MSRVLVALFLLSSRAVFAHELRPAYLELHEDQPAEFSVLWKTPMRGELRLALSPVFSGRTETLAPPSTWDTGDAAVQIWRLKAIESLRGQSVRIAGLEGTMTDVLVRLEFADGTTWMQRLTPAQPAAVIPKDASSLHTAFVYLALGIEHILTGVDHLLFVLALLLITGGGWQLAKTVTAFTVSHSITLTAATLGFVHVPQRPVEAVIALSIMFVAAEILHGRQGRVGITARAPWIVALTFGLLHGLGFAGGLSEAGLPQGHIPLALLFFSIGVETGHFLFIATALSLIALARRVQLPLPQWAPLIPPYAIGCIATFWMIQRIAAF
jgi:hypothetical protein